MRAGINVFLWDRKVGTLIENGTGALLFSYNEEYIKNGLDISPLMMPLSRMTYQFPLINYETYQGLPGLIADSLPDRFGNKLIEQYVANQGRATESLTVTEKLSYIGKRGMGALEFVPTSDFPNFSKKIDMDKLAELSNVILTERENIHIYADENAIATLLAVGTSAGGARAKAVVAWNEQGGIMRSGQINAGQNFTYWIVKFGNVRNSDRDVTDKPEYYQQIEYAYSLMAKDAGLEMTDCKLVKSAGGKHFFTKRFDRTDTGEKIHSQTLCGLAHMDYNNPGAHSYEELAQVMEFLKLSYQEKCQMFKRIVFNEATKNYDDHTKNISFLMDKTGKWTLSPAYDITYSYNPQSKFTSTHQITINGKRENISESDLLSCATHYGLSKSQAHNIIQKTVNVINRWSEYARHVQIPKDIAEYIHSKFNTFELSPNNEQNLSYLQKSKELSDDGTTTI